MCDERERLIGYVYDECEPGDRRQVETHLATCPACREELGALRQVRQDLLAWEVPEHGSVWRPFAPPRPALSLRDVPAWAMAVAAGAIFFFGAAGGVATRAWWPASTQAPSVVATATAPLPVITATDLAALEMRVTQRVRAELVSRPITTSHTAAAAGDTKQVGERVAALEREYLEWKDDQRSLIVQLTNDVVGLKRARAAAYDSRVDPSGRVIPVSNFIR